MGRKLPYTPNSHIRSALRRLWLRSRERQQRLKDDKYTCQSCHRKQSRAKGKEFKVQVHHKNMVVNWEKLIEEIRKNLLCDPGELVTLCDECHEKKHKEDG